MKTIAMLLWLLALPAAAQQTTINLKPLKGVWKPADVASVEVRVRGRLTTDPASTHRIIGRVTLSKFDWVSALTMRTTLLVPATQTWEVKSLSLLVNTAAATGLASAEVITQTLAVPHVAPAGKTLAIDVDTTTGVLVLGPVDMTPTLAPAPVVTSSPNGTILPPAAQLVDTTQGVWTLGAVVSGKQRQILLNGTVVGTGETLQISARGIFAWNGNNGYSMWNGTTWVGGTP